MHYYILKLLPAIAFAVLAGCGQMGPLYMPPEETPPPPPAVAEPDTEQPDTEQPGKQR